MADDVDPITIGNLQASLETAAWHVVQTAKRCAKGGKDFDWEDLINDIQDIQSLHYVIWTYTGGDKPTPRLISQLLVNAAKEIAKEEKKKARGKKKP